VVLRFAIMIALSAAEGSHHHDAVLRAPPDRWVGGASRDRTDDLLLAKQALSQLSYGPRSVSPARHAPASGGSGRS
jgi:hypothetical protein